MVRVRVSYKVHFYLQYRRTKHIACISLTGNSQNCRRFIHQAGLTGRFNSYWIRVKIGRIQRSVVAKVTKLNDIKTLKHYLV